MTSVSECGQRRAGAGLPGHQAKVRWASLGAPMFSVWDEHEGNYAVPTNPSVARRDASPVPQRGLTSGWKLRFASSSATPLSGRVEHGSWLQIGKASTKRCATTADICTGLTGWDCGCPRLSSPAACHSMSWLTKLARSSRRKDVCRTRSACACWATQGWRLPSNGLVGRRSSRPSTTFEGHVDRAHGPLFVVSPVETGGGT